MDSDLFKVYTKIWLIFLVLIALNACDTQESNTSENIVGVTKKALNAYDVRSLVIDEIMKAHPIKQQLEKYWKIHGNFKGVSIKPRDHGFKINRATGVIKIHLSQVSQAFNAGDNITMHPEIDNDYFDWQCRSNVTSNLVPGSCQE